MAKLGIHMKEYEAQAAFAQGGLPQDVSGRDGETLYGKTFPPFVFFDTNGDVRAVGEHAKNERARNPGLVVWGVTRFVGMSYDEAFKVEDGFRLFGYEDRIERTDSGGIAIRFGAKLYTPTDVLAIILGRMKEDAENIELNPMLNGKVDGAVITVPAYFDATRVAAVLRAAQLAGFGKVGEQITETAEPTAAMLAYVNANRGTLPRGGRGLHVLTFDMGAGTTDVTLNRFDLLDGNLLATEVSLEGDNHVGGINMDSTLLEFLKTKYANTGLVDDANAQAKLLPKIEQAKIELAEYPEMERASLLTVVGGKPARFELSREELVAALMPVWDRAVLPLHELLRESKRRANVGPDRVDIVLFLGGSAKMPWLRQRVLDELAEIGVRPEVLAQIDRIEVEGFPPGCDPDTVVAHGAALAASKTAFSPKLNPYGYGIVVADRYYVPILEDNQPCPTEEKSATIPVFEDDGTAIRLACGTRVLDPVSGNTRTQYRELGEYDLDFSEDAGVHLVRVGMRTTETRRLIVTLTDLATGHSRVVESPDRYAGQELQLQKISVEAVAILENDRHERFFDALCLTEEASVDEIRTREVELAHRYRAMPNVVAAVHHAAEMAVVECRWRIDIPAIIERVKQWRPAWPVPAEDTARFLYETINYDVLVAGAVELARGSRPPGDPGVAVSFIAIGELKSEEPKLRKSMARWYCCSVDVRLAAAFSGVSPRASVSTERARRLLQELVSAEQALAHAIQLDARNAEVAKMRSAIRAARIHFEPQAVPLTKRVLKGAGSVAGGVGTVLLGLLIQLIPFALLLGVLALLTLLCNR